MKFNEKLISLRKSKGMSQEELGEKLNVTRQTVSKWELGVTTPEMDKLVEMSKIFNVTVDNLINENDNNETVKEEAENPIKETTKKNNPRKWPIIIVVILLIMLIIFAFRIIATRYLFNQGEKLVDKYTDKGTGIINHFLDFVDSQDKKMEEEYNSKVNKMKEEYNNDFEENANKMLNWFNTQSDKMEKEHEEKYQQALKEQKEYMDQAKKEQQKYVEEGLKNSQELVKKYNK